MKSFALSDVYFKLRFDKRFKKRTIYNVHMSKICDARHTANHAGL